MGGELRTNTSSAALIDEEVWTSDESYEEGGESGYTSGALMSLQQIRFAAPPTTRPEWEPGSRPVWARAAVLELTRLAEMSHGWAFEDSVPPEWSVIRTALAILPRVCSRSTTQPDLVPLPSGGLQIEWHTLSGDAEILIEPS